MITPPANNAPPARARDPFLAVLIGCSAVAALCGALYPFSGDYYGVAAGVGLTAGASALAAFFGWVARAARTSNSRVLRGLETLRSYLADEPASFERPEVRR